LRIRKRKRSPPGGGFLGCAAVRRASIYTAYFNDAYITFKEELETYTKLPEKHYSDDRIEVLLSRIH
jgi:hypothetical protein